MRGLLNFRGVASMLAMVSAMVGENSAPPSARLVNSASYDQLIDEYILIHQKKSKLSRSQRDSIVARVERLIREGKIVCPLALEQESILFKTPIKST